MITALETIGVYDGNDKFDMGSSVNRDGFLKKFKSTWKMVLLAPLDYSFDSYMKRTGIDNAWLEEWYEGRTNNNNIIMIKEFTCLVTERLNKHLSKYKS